MIRLFSILILLILSGCRDDYQLPPGFEEVSKDGNSHFLFVQKENVGDRVAQRAAGRAICKGLYKQEEYCEAYFFDKKSAIPLKFPMINRIAPLGVYEIRNGKEKFKILFENDSNTP